MPVCSESYWFSLDLYDEREFLGRNCPRSSYFRWSEVWHHALPYVCLPWGNACIRLFSQICESAVNLIVSAWINVKSGKIDLYPQPDNHTKSRNHPSMNIFWLCYQDWKFKFRRVSNVLSYVPCELQIDRPYGRQLCRHLCSHMWIVRGI
jgi:hypothetical protein